MTPARAVFDCVVFLQGAARESSPAGACLRLVEEGLVTLHVSPQILAEVAEVLTRPKSRQRFQSLATGRVEAFLRQLVDNAVLVDSVPDVFFYPRDPDDEPYVNLALAAGARYLVTWDNDLLDLMREELPEGKTFRERFPDLFILTPPAFLGEMRQQQPAAPPG